MKKPKLKIFSFLADILEYPSDHMAERVREAAAAFGAIIPSAKPLVDGFAEYCRTNPLSGLEEIYTDTFDLQPICPPYVGYHLFGEDRARGMFMVRLKEHYRNRIACGGELPDHITLMLRSLDFEDANEENSDLKEYCLIPAVKKMMTLLKDSRNPYKGILQAILLILEADDSGEVIPANYQGRPDSR